MNKIEIRDQTFGEEVANSLSHGAGLLFAVISMPVLLFIAARGSATQIVGAAIFSATMLLLYSASMLYHALPSGRAKRVFVKLDHGAIYIFIAGSYTPFALGALHGPWGWSLFGVVWALAAVGVTLKAIDRLTNPIWSTALYLLMGWLVLVAAVPIVERIPTAGLIWLVAGGLSYTIGVGFFLTDHRLRFGHLIWHLFVLGGTICHFFAVLWYAQ